MLSVQLKRPARENDYRVAESYKALRTNVQFCGVDNKVIMLTSSMPGEGKSSTSFNLAASLGEIGKKVLLIDADMRRSNMIKQYRVETRVKGLSEFLSGQNGIDEVLYATNIMNVHIIFAGAVPPNPAELLNNRIFTRTIEKLRELYDYIVIDTPPIGSVTDAAVISQVCDGIIFVCASGSIRRKMAQDIVRQLSATKCKILGTVLTRVERSGKGYYGKYYGKYGDYYGAYGKGGSQTH
ncbi:MAG TPA: CpsD/CapB family tyrosine-protein kinase [Candidatus Fimimorpha excrementavium]|nr:CpsD/CapB family tyrosine-protein kinase [Candidatus Fimimorpha excrementavium]